MKKRLVLIAGPCVIESEENATFIAERIKAISEKLGLDYYFKASFDKANRTSIKSYRGPGIEEGLAIPGRIKDKVAVMKSVSDDLSEVAYIGDDMNDMACMKTVKAAGGLVGCPSDAAVKVKDIASSLRIVEGEGAVQDFIEWIIGK